MHKLYLLQTNAASQKVPYLICYYLNACTNIKMSKEPDGRKNGQRP